MDNKNFEYKGMYWNIYENLEKEVIDLSYHICFTDGIINNKDIRENNQLSVFSNKIADILISCCIQIEALFTELYKKIETRTNEDSIGAKISEVNNYFNLEPKEIKIISQSMYFNELLGDYFSPMSYKAHDINDYYSAYCAVKHDRINALYKANVNILLRALGALYILNLYYMHFNSEGMTEANFSLTQGSKVFITSVEDIPTEKNIFVYKQNVQYEQQLNDFISSIPSDFAEIDRYERFIPQPQSALIFLNIKKEEQTNG